MKKLLAFLVLLVGGVLVFAQDVVTLEGAIRDTAKVLIDSEKLENDEILAVLSVESNNNALSEYIIDHLTAELTKSPRFIVISRNDQIRKLRDRELNYQASGDVDERTKTEMGTALGLNTIISGKIVPRNDGYEMTISATTLGSSINLVQHHTYIKKNDPAIASFDVTWKTQRFYAGGRVGGTLNIFSLNRTAGLFKEGDANPAGGFNAAGEFSWQFMEWPKASFSAQAELIFSTLGKMKWKGEDDWQDISVTNILIPILFKPNFYINNWYFSPFLGAYLNMSWGNYSFSEQGSDWEGSGDVTFDTRGGVAIGGDIGYKMGPGILFLDLRYLIDLGRTRPNKITGGSMIYGQQKKDTIATQQMAMLTVGYKFGFGGK